MTRPSVNPTTDRPAPGSPTHVGAGALGPGSDDLGADAIVTLTRQVPGVSDLYGGAMGEIATYLPGRRVPGVRVDEERIEVHLVVELTRPVQDTAEAVHRSLSTVAGEREVRVHVDDVRSPGEDPERDRHELGSAGVLPARSA